MKKLVGFSLLLLAGFSVAGAVVGDVYAIPPFKKEFDALYVKEGTEFAKIVGEAKCNLCHEGMNKKDRNAYGQELSKLLDKTKDGGNAEKIQDALKKVAEMKVNPDDEKSKTYGELIKEGKLPGAKD